MPSKFEETPNFIKMDELNEDLDKFEEEMVGLTRHSNSKEPICLRMPLDLLRKKTPEELSEMSLELSRYSMSVQRTINRLNVWSRWGKAKLDSFAAEELENVPNNYGYSEKILIAKNKPEVCKQLNGFLREIDMKLTRLYSLPDHIKIISDSIRDMKFSAIRREKEYQNSD